MSRRFLTFAVIVCACTLTVSGSVGARAVFDATTGGRSGGSQATQQVATMAAMHNVGQLVLAISNTGTFASGFLNNLGIPEQDYFTGEPIPAGGGEYPKGSTVQYVFAASFWIGAVVGRDTLVSTGADGWVGVTEMFPDVAPFGNMKYRSIIDPSAPEFEDAISEEDYIAAYTDTNTVLPPNDEALNRPHKPLNVKVTQSSFAWSYSYAEDLVLFDYQIENIGSRSINNAFMGIYVDADVCADCDQGQGFADDICGFLITQDRLCNTCEYEDTVYIAWIADNDGDLTAADPLQPAPHVTATRIVRTPAETLDVSFNWWVSNGNPNLDYGPRERPNQGTWKEPFRDFGTGGTGTPAGDHNRYYQLRNQEFDYDQAFTSTIGPNDPLWLEPPAALKNDVADGFDTRYLLSFGPFNISPGQRLPLSFAYVAGEDLHTDIDNAQNLLNADPVAFYNGLDFNDLGLNSTWASWIYDNPGVDSDSDGYFGEFEVCVLDSTAVDTTIVTDSLGNPIDTTFSFEPTVAETCWTVGDGIPDFRGASPPPAPDFWLEPIAPPYPIESPYGQIRVLFNGLRSETTRDVFSNEFDFEGYRVYVGRDNRSTSFTLLVSYDIEDYNKFVFDDFTNEWVLRDTPLRPEEIEAIYGIPANADSILQYTRTRPFIKPSSDSLFYFAPQDFNFSDLSNPDGIQKVYPNAPYPSTLDPAEADSSDLTPEGRFKYFEYEFVIKDLLPSVPWYVNVTAFDYGSPQSGLEALETNVTLGAKDAYPLATAKDVQDLDLEVLVYPNPYRIDAGYRGLGFEGRRRQDFPDNRVREIHFANLPAKCVIRIFTIDGDLVREIEHDEDPNDPNASHDSWDLITRNTQMVVSGLYYWTVEDESGEVQIGKLAIIM